MQPGYRKTILNIYQELTKNISRPLKAAAEFHVEPMTASGTE
jgi:hypothetical protein